MSVERSMRIMKGRHAYGFSGDTPGAHFGHLHGAQLLLSAAGGVGGRGRESKGSCRRVSPAARKRGAGRRQAHQSAYCRWFRQRDVNGRRLEEFVLSDTVVNDLVGQQKRSDLEKLVRMQV